MRMRSVTPTAQQGRCARTRLLKGAAVLIGFIGLLLNGSGASALGDSESGDVRERWDIGAGLNVAYGNAVAVRGRSSGRDVADPEFVAVFASVGPTFADFSDGDGWWRGQFDGLLEGAYIRNFEPSDGNFGGASALLRYRFVAPRRITPYVEVGAGLGYLDFDLNSQDDGFNFIVQTGLGLRWPLGERFAITTSGRWYHISNAGLRSPNRGIDSFLAVLGVDFH